MHTIKKYFGVYRAFLSNAFSVAMSFRFHFVLLVLMDLMFYFSSLAGVEFIFDHVDRIGPWSRDEFLFFISFMLAVDHLHMTFISESFWNFSYEIRTGRLDFVLLKPIGTLFNIFFRNIRPATMLNIVVPWGCMYYFGTRSGLGLMEALAVIPLIFLALTLLVSLEILLCMSMFWIIESFGINFLRMQFQQMSRWPDFIYKYMARKVFTFFVPILLIGSAPVRFLFDRFDFYPLLFMLVACGFSWFLISVFWRYGLKNYESASS